MIDEKTLRVAKIISFNPFEANNTVKFICDLADKYCITIEGIAQPAMVGPSVTKNDTFYVGMNIDRLLKWYQKYGFEIQDINSKYHIKRSPKMKIKIKQEESRIVVMKEDDTVISIWNNKFIENAGGLQKCIDMYKKNNPKDVLEIIGAAPAPVEPAPAPVEPAPAPVN